MKKFSILRVNYQGWIFLGMLIMYGGALRAQSIHIAAGTVMSQYDYVSSDGEKFDNFKSGSGSYYRMGAEFKLLDTLSLITSTSPKAFFYSNHKMLAKILSRTNFVSSIEMDQLNAVGDVIGVAFNYQTNYLGVSAGLNYMQPLFKGWIIKPTVKVQGLKILQGNQELLGAYKDLTMDSDFNKLQVALGWEVSLSKQINSGLQSFISFSKLNTMNSLKAGSSSLNFHNTIFSIGLLFTTNKK